MTTSLPAPRLGRAFAQLGEQLLVSRGVAPEPLALRVRVAAELAHALASSRWRRTFLRTLPVGVIGSSSTNSISRGYSCAPRRLLTSSLSSDARSSPPRLPSRRTT